MEGEILERELEFHRKVATDALASLVPTPDYIIERYSKARHWRVFTKERIFHYVRKQVQQANNLELVIGEFGCGDGINSCELVRTIPGFRMESFDISQEQIDVARKRSELNCTTDRIIFFVADAELDPMRGQQVDIMLALSILHHVDIKKVVPALISSTKPGGLLVFHEPIAFSSLLQKIRDALPVKKNVSPDERQLVKSEIDYLIGSLSNPQVHYCMMVGRLARFLPNANKIDKGHPFTKYLLIVLGWIDNTLLTLFPFMSKYAGRVMIIGNAPQS